MTPTHTLAATIARAVVDSIERDRTLILQNIEEVVLDALLLNEAKQRKSQYDPWIAKAMSGDWGGR